MLKLIADAITLDITKRISQVRKIGLAFVILIFFSGFNGCDWGNSHRSNTEVEIEEEQPVVTEAPLSAFSISSQSGKAPLTATFSDDSTNGTATITAWQWNFGDGGESTEQNPQYIYQAAGTYDVGLTVTSADGSDSSSQSAAVIVDPADTVTKITVVDVRGLPLTDVTATSEVFSIETQSSNESSQLLVNMRPNESQGIIRLKKEGYVDGLAFLDGAMFDSTIPVTLIRLQPAIIFDGLMGGEYIGIDGASVKLPENALIKPDGSAVNGPVELYITPVDISDNIQRQAFPGSFYGLPDESEIPDGEPLQHMIVSYGVVEYSFYQGGEELQLKEGASADLQLPIYSNISLYGEDIQIGEMIPLWTLNEVTGIWVQEGVGTVIANPAVESGLSLSAQTTHFSWFNTDAWFGFGGGGSGGFPGAGAGGGMGWCDFRLDFIGADPDRSIYYTLELLLYGNLFIANTIDDNFIGGSVPEGTGVRVNAFQGDDKYGTVNFGCTAAGEGPIELTFGEAAPEFRNWEVLVEPIFERLSPGDDYVISKNSVRVGGRFVGTETVDIQTDLLNAEILGLPNLQFMELEFDGQLHASPTTVTSTLTNEFGTTNDSTVIDFIESHSPVLDHFYANPGENSVFFSWAVEGADEGAVYYLEEDPSALGLLMFRIDDIDGGVYEDSQLINSTGFIRIEFSNFYGSTTIISRLADLNCIPGSELPGCFPTN